MFQNKIAHLNFNAKLSVSVIGASDEELSSTQQSDVVIQDQDNLIGVTIYQTSVQI